MSRLIRKTKQLSIRVGNNLYPVSLRETPFREGVELSCTVNGKEFRVSDRGLGEEEALRLLKLEIKKSEEG